MKILHFPYVTEENKHTMDILFRSNDLDLSTFNFMPNGVMAINESRDVLGFIQYDVSESKNVYFQEPITLNGLNSKELKSVINGLNHIVLARLKHSGYKSVYLHAKNNSSNELKLASALVKRGAKIYKNSYIVKVDL